MEENKLMELNKNAFKEIFYNKLVENNSKFITQKQFFKFLCDLRIFPDLISALTLKKLLQDLKMKKKGEISEKNFFRLIFLLANQCFPGADPVKNFFTAIRTLCKDAYKVYLITKPVNQVKIRKNLKISPEKREVCTQRRVLNKSTSQKLSLSGLISPKNNSTIVKKISLARSPVIKLLKPKPNPEKLEKIIKLFKKFKQSLPTSPYFPTTNHKLCPFFEGFLKSKLNTVILTQSYIIKLHFELWRLKTQIFIT